MDIAKYINNTGYKSGSNTKYNPFNIIPGGDITMDDVAMELIALPIKDGAVQKPTLMKPDKNYKFDSDYVLELPKAQNGFDFMPNMNLLKQIYQQNQSNNQHPFDPFYDMANSAITGANVLTSEGVYNKGTEEYFGHTDVDTFPLMQLNRSPLHPTNELTEIKGTTPLEVTSSTTNVPSQLPNTTVQQNSNNVLNNILGNPALYSGVDLSSALFKTGQSFGFDSDIIESPEGRRKAKNANLLRGIGATGKSVLNIGRLIGAGLGHQNRLQQYYKDYNEQQRSALVNNFRFQSGGEFNQLMFQQDTVNDLVPNLQMLGELLPGEPYEEPTTPQRSQSVEEKVVNGLVQRGFSKEEAAALAGNMSVESTFDISIEGDKHLDHPSYGLMQWRGNRKKLLFEKYGKQPTLDQQLDFVKYELRGGDKYETKMFNRAKDRSKGVEELAYNIAKYVERPSTKALKHSGPERSAAAAKYFKDIDLVNFLRNGGTVEDVPTSTLLTGEYYYGLPKSQENTANAEIEDKEYVRHNNGDIQEAKGEVHDKGGIKVNLEVGTRVLSNKLTVSKDLSERLSKEYGLKTSTKDTYSGLVNKYTKQIGLEKLNKEQEELFERLEKQEGTKDETSKGLNQEYLGNEIRKIEKKKEPLLDLRKSFFQQLFEAQEESKELGENKEFALGGLVVDENTKKLAKRYGLSMEQVTSLLKENSLKSMQVGGTYPLYSEHENKFRDPSLYVHQKTGEQVGDTTYFGQVNSENVNDRILETLRIFPGAERFMNVKRDGSGKIVSATFDSNAKVGEFQTYVQGVYDNLIDYSNNSSDFDDVSKESFKQFVNKLKFSDEEIAKNFDSSYGNFTSSRSGAGLQLVTEDELKALNKAGVTNFTQLYNDSGDIKDELKSLLGGTTINKLDGIQTKYGNNFEAFLLPNKPEEVVEETYSGGTLPEITITPDPAPDEVVEETEFVPSVNLTELRNRFDFPLLPDQSALPPEGLVPHLMIDRTFQRLDPAEISVEPHLQEAARQESFGAQQLSNLPDSQRRAALSSMLANSQGNINKVISQTEAQNALNRQQTEQFNIGQANQEENYRAVDSLDFERRSLTGLAKTQENIARYFDFNRKVRLGNFNTVSSLNTLNSIYENFNTNGSGIDFDNSKEVLLRANYLNQLLGK